MAIAAGGVVDTFDTAVTVADASTSAVATLSWSVQADAAAWTNSDDVMEASVVGSFTMTGSLAAGTIGLYARPLNILSTNDAPIPDDNYPETFLGLFPLNEDATIQYQKLIISLENIVDNQPYEFYIRNNMAVSVAAGWSLELIPKAPAPKA